MSGEAIAPARVPKTQKKKRNELVSIA